MKLSLALLLTLYLMGDIKIPRNHLQLAYFGFAVVDCRWDDPLDQERKDQYLSEVASLSNVAQLCVFSPNEELRPRLKAFENVQVKALLHVETVLFEQVAAATDPSGYHLQLFPDALQRWQKFLQRNGPSISVKTVAAFYIADEPFWHGLSAQNLRQATVWIKNTFPKIPTVVIEAAPALRRMDLPEELDWVGFDHYGVAAPDTDPTYQSELEILKSKLKNPQQKIVLIADTQWQPQYRGRGLNPDDMKAVFEHYVHLANLEPRVVALLGYIWPGGLEGPDHLGARELPPAVQQEYQAYGSKFR